MRLFAIVEFDVVEDDTFHYAALLDEVVGAEGALKAGPYEFTSKVHQVSKGWPS